MRAHVVLNVNDDEVRRYVIGRVLRDGGFDVVDAATGAEALALVGARQPDVVVLDVKLPDVNGFEVCRRIKADPRTSPIPVVMLSAVLTEDVHRVQGLESGADGYLTDPHPAVMIATLRALLRAREAEDARRESEIQYRALFEGMPVPAWVADLDTLRMLAVNDAAVRTFGYSREELLAMHLVALRPPDEAARLLGFVAGPTRGIDIGGTWKYLRKDGTVFEADITSRRVLYQGRDARLVIAVDVTDRRRAERRQATQLAVTHILAESPTLDEAVPRLLEAMCEGLGWDIGELWRRDDGTDTLSLAAAWHRHGIAATRLDAVTRDVRHERGKLLVGRVWDTAWPMSTSDVGAELHPARAHVVAELGMRSALAVPVIAGGEVTSVLLLMTGEPSHVEDAVVGMVADLGTRIGEFIERKRAESALVDAEARYRLALRATNDAVWEWDPAAGLVFAGDGVAALFGAGADDIRADVAWWVERIHPDDRERVVQGRERAIASASDVWADEYRFRAPSGRYAEVRDRGYILRDATGRAIRMVGAMGDITEEKLREERNRLRALSLGVLRAREDEARRIAHELHNEAGQLLASVHIALARLIRDLPVEHRVRFGAITELLDRTEEHLRLLAHELRPTILDDLGLGPALEALGERVSSRSSTEVVVRVALDERVPSVVETAVYRIVQEALTNAIKHGRPTQVTIDVAVEADQLHAVVTDDGAGFDVVETLRRTGQRGLGLLGVAERVDALGGMLEVSAQRGEGTTLRVVIPLDQHVAQDPAR